MNLDGAQVCIVMLSALGDTVHVLPVINALKRHAPSVRITWVLEAAGARLMTGHPLVDEIVVHGKGAGALLRLRETMKGRRFDLLIDLQVAFKAGLATLMIPADVKLGFDRARARDANWLFTNTRIPPHEPQHVQDQYFEFLRLLRIDPEPVQWQLGPWAGETSVREKLLSSADRDVVTLALATTWEEKNWIPERWAELAAKLYREHGLQPVLAGSSSATERAIERVIVEQSGVPIISTLGCSLRNLVGVLYESVLVITPDTAPLHMSVALGTPAIALMGYTNPRRVGPYRCFHDLMVDAYTDEGEYGTAALQYRAGRMATIEVGDVMERVRIWAERYRGRSAHLSGATPV
jgi:heptosyltransferase I